MKDSFFKGIAIPGFIVAAFAALVLLGLGHGIWSWGVLVSTCWIFLNTFFLFQLVEMGLNPAPKHKDKILLISILKFPVLYVAGYFILKSRFFPIYSLLLGLTLFMLVFTGAWLRTNLRKDQVGKGLKQSVLSLLFLIGTLLINLRPAYASEEASHEGTKGASLHILNFVHLIAQMLGHGSVFDFLNRFENVIFGVIVISILAAVFYFASRKAAMVPGRLQGACETIVDGLNGFVCGILGPEGKKYTPFLGTLFLYIWTMNLLGLVPLMKAPTTNSMELILGPITIPIPTTTAALAILVFCYVQFIGIKEQGILGYLDHMAGTPRDVFGYVLLPIMFIIHVIGEFAKPLSLAFRLYGNIWGEDVLLAVFIGLGIGVFSFMPIPAGAPIHFPFLLLALVTGTIQAFVFTLLSTVYIAMMLPHEHKEEHHKTAHA